MANYQYYQGFKLTDKSTGEVKRLIDFGGTIYNPNSDGFSINLLPEPKHITDKNENQDGERYVKTVYNSRIIEIPVIFSDKNGETELFELNKWLGKKHQQVFEWEDDEEHKEIDVIYQKGFDMNVLFGEKFNGLTTLSFIAHNPYWRIKNEQPLIYNNLNNSNNFIIKNKGNSDCYPLIKITPNGVQETIEFQWNENDIILTNIDKPFYIDCQAQKCYELDGTIKIPTLTKYKSNEYYDFPKLYSDKINTINILQGEISELYIKLNTRII